MKTSLGAAQERLSKSKAKLAGRESELQRAKAKCRTAIKSAAGSPAGLSVSLMLGWVTAGRVIDWVRESGPRQRLGQSFSVSSLAFFAASTLRALRHIRDLRLHDSQSNESALSNVPVP